MSEDPKESRTNRAKDFKADSIIKTKELLIKLQKIYNELRTMSDEDVEKLLSQSPLGKSWKSTKEKEKEFVVSMIMEAHNNVNTRIFFQERGIDLNDKTTQKLIEQQVAVHAMGH